MKPIFLIGYMASGKTTLGRALSERAGVEFVDLDEFIERFEGMTIARIFSERGEAGFREAERAALHTLAAAPASARRVIACGGGTPCFFDNMDFMNRVGTTIFLQAQTATLCRRLELQRAERPLLAGVPSEKLPEVIETALAKRMPHYSRALYTFTSDHLESNAEIEESVSAFVCRFLSAEE